MFILFLLAVIFFLLFSIDKGQTAKALALPGYVEKNPVQKFIWLKVVNKSKQGFFFVNFLLAVLALLVGGLIWNTGGVVWACVYFGLGDAGFIYVVIANAKILPKAA